MWETEGDPGGFVEAVDFLDAKPVHPAGVVTVAVRMDYEAGRVWSRTTFEPKSARDLLLTLGHRIAWNWVMPLLADDPIAKSEVGALLDNFDSQFEFYAEAGVAKDFFLRNVGRAPFYAMAKGSGTRYVEELAAAAGMTADEFRALPEPEKDRLIAEDTERSLAQLDEPPPSGNGAAP
jgi:hypothetical protein